MKDEAVFSTQGFVLVYDGLERSIVENAAHIEHFQRAPTSLIAWACRNLLELRVWAEYCTRSPENAESFFLDSAKDLFDMHKTADGSPIIADAKEDTAVLEHSRQQLWTLVGPRLKGKPHVYLNVSEVADALGLNPFFRREYKILSKYAHPTALTIVLRLPEDEDLALRNGFLMNGTKFAADAREKIQVARHHLSASLTGEATAPSRLALGRCPDLES